MKTVATSEYGFHAKDWALFPTERPDPIAARRTCGTIRAVRSAFDKSGSPYAREDAADARVEDCRRLLKDGKPLVVPAKSTLRFLWDLDDYSCAYPELETGGGRGARIRWSWAESLYGTNFTGLSVLNKGNRDVFVGKRVLHSMDDTFLCDGRAEAKFTTPWWRSGRWVEVAVATADEPLTLRHLAIVESRYPMEPAMRFDCDDPTIGDIQRICVRGLQNCLHEMYMDCPYFEQQMYPGDTRVEMLVQNAVSGDDRINRFGMGIFDYARRDDGLIPMNFPSRNIQDSATYSMCWAMMFGDQVLWHGTNAWLKARLPGLRQTMSALAQYENAEGLVENLPGWSFMDWVPEWDTFGNAPDGRRGLSALNNLLYVLALQSVSKTERALGETVMAEYWNAKSRRTGEAIVRTFWSDARGLVADTVAKDRFSEHAQCLALLADILPSDRAARAFGGLTEAADLARATVYFSHYLFDTYLKFGRADLFLRRLDLWRGYVRDGLRTPVEAPGVRARSDCHAWGAHPLYHLATGVAGVSPTADGYATVRVAPQPAHLKFIRATAPTPKGAVTLDLRFDAGNAVGTVTLPPGLTGVFRWANEDSPLKPGTNAINRPCAPDGVCAPGKKVPAAEAAPVWPAGREAEMNGFYRFCANVVSESATNGVLKATAGYAYRAKVNGRFVGYGPARSVPGFFRLDEWPVALAAGTNAVEIEVAGYNCNNFYLPDQRPFLWAEVACGGHRLASTGTNGAFVAREAGRVRRAPRFCYQRGFAEIYRLPETRTAPLPLAEQPPKKFLSREWAYPDFRVTAPFVAVSTETVGRDEAAKLTTPRCLVQSTPGYKIYPLGELEENPHFDLQKIKTVSRRRGASVRNGWHPLSANEGVVFEAPREYAGFPRFRAKCRVPVAVYFTFDEFLQSDGSVDSFRAGTLGAVVWHLAPGEYELEGFEPVAFKCARILAVGGTVEVTAPSVRTYVSPSADRASFRASDPAYERIFTAAKASYAANAVDCLTDCPIRERAGWLGDSFFTGRASQWLTGSGANERLFLDNFLRPAGFGSAPEFAGLVPAVWPCDLMTKDCFIPNYDMWFVLELADYVRRTGDGKLAEALRPRVLETIGALDRHLNSDGLLEKLPGWVFVEWSRANRLVQDVNYPSNMMYAETLSTAARLYGLPALAARAAKMRETIRRQSLTADGWYCDNAVRRGDGSLKPSGERTEVCQYYAFFTGVATKERDATLWERLVRDFGPERIRNAKWDDGGNLGLRLSTPMREGVWKEIWPANMIFGTCLRMELLSRDGRSAQVAREMKENFLPMAEKTGTLWEHVDPRASCCHGFAAIAAEYLYRDVLGVREIDARAKTVRVEPPSDVPLDWCEGDVPLPDGEVAFVRWTKAKAGPVVDVSLPGGWIRR